MVISATSMARGIISHGRADTVPQLMTAFTELGWRPTALELRGRGTAISLVAGGSPQILVTPIRVDDSAGSVSLGYSHEAPLTLDWSQDALRVHSSSGWRGVPGDTPLVEADPNDTLGVAHVLDAVARDQFHGLTDHVSGDLHPPLAELLAQAFAEFRRQVVDSEVRGTGPRELEALRLFHQLLFMRFQEDRFAVPKRLRVARALEADDLPRQLAAELGWYSERFNSELFADALDPDRLPQAALREVIRQLVEPWARLRLDFSVTTNEVAGRLYQSYLRLAPTRIDEGRLFPGAEIRSKQKQRGAYYTPAPVARLLVRETLKAALAHRQPREFGDLRIVDPACGSGAFLVAAYKALIRFWESRFERSLTEGERAEILSTSIFGVDEDPAAVMLTRVHLLEEAELADHLLPELSKNVVPGDSLTGQGLPDNLLAEESYDVFLTNPPFASPRQLADMGGLDELVQRFASLRGTGRNVAYAFGELALNLLRPGGYAGMLVPRALLDGPSSAAARETLGSGHVLGIADFGRNTVFEDTQAYVAALVLSRDEVRRPSVARLRDDVISTVDLLDALEDIDLTEGEAGSAVITASLHPPREAFASSNSWAPFTLRWRFQLQQHIGIATTSLGDEEAPEVVIGTQTGADKSFVVEPSDYDLSDDHVVVRGVSIPLRFAPYWVKGQDILPFRCNRSGLRVIVPQVGEDPAVDRFIALQGGPPGSFRAGRLDLLRRPKILVRNLFSEPAAVADLHGEFMPPQAVVTALVPPAGDAVEIQFGEALLNSSLYQWLLQGLAHPRDLRFGRLMLHHWADVPWPIVTAAERHLIVDAGEEVRRFFNEEAEGSPVPESVRPDAYWKARHELDERVFRVLRVQDALRRIVESELWRLA